MLLFVALRKIPLFLKGLMTMSGSWNFRRGGGGGGPGQSDKKSSDVVFFFFFFFFFFFLKSSAYLTEVKWSISKKSICFQGS